MVLAGDKGPFSTNNLSDPTGFPSEYDDYDDNTSPNEWKALNSPNHGGRGAGEGENLLFADGHVEFVRKPIVGIDGDNVYTLMVGPEDPDRWVGGSPITCTDNGVPSRRAWPGMNTFDSGQVDSSTDTLIYP